LAAALRHEVQSEARGRDVDRHEAAAVVMRVPQRQLPTTVQPILGIVDVEPDAPRHRFEAVGEQVEHRRHHALQPASARQILRPVASKCHRYAAKAVSGLARPINFISLLKSL
jgi:hypothetical protein